MNSITKMADIPLQTEDTGKMFEMAICLAYGIQYDGKYKYGMEIPEKLAPRLKKLQELFPACSHTAKQGARYDFTSLSDASNHLSAKTTKKGIGKVAPQVIGQANPLKFCSILNIPYTTDAELKKYIQTNISSILPILTEYTFDCPNIYYNHEMSSIKFITLMTLIVWNSFEYQWTRDHTTWNNSSTLKIKCNGIFIPIVEFQFHTKRKNMAIRWIYDNFLSVFKNNLTIVDL